MVSYLSHSSVMVPYLSASSMIESNLLAFSRLSGNFLGISKVDPAWKKSRNLLGHCSEQRCLMNLGTSTRNQSQRQRSRIWCRTCFSHWQTRWCQCNNIDVVTSVTQFLGIFLTLFHFHIRVWNNDSCWHWSFDNCYYSLGELREVHQELVWHWTITNSTCIFIDIFSLLFTLTVKL